MVKIQASDDLSAVFAENLKKYRKNANMTQKELADKLLYSEKGVSKWERGSSIPPAEVLLRLSGLFHISIEALLSRQDTVYYLGIDGGATKTALCLTDCYGRTERHITIGSTNPFDIGIQKSEALLRDAIAEITEGISFSSVYMFAGLSGGSSGTTKEQLHTFFESFHFAAFENGSDNENLIAAGLHGQDGITVILGTGICVFSVCGGNTHRIGGWGYLFDDGGSGFNLGRDAVHAYFAAYDGSGAPTALTELIEAKAGCGGQKLLGILYDGGKREIASYAPLVITAAQQGDSVAEAILKRNIHCAAELIVSGARDFDASCREIPVVCAGGLTENTSYMEALKETLEKNGSFAVSTLACEPVTGAVQKAMKLHTNE